MPRDLQRLLSAPDITAADVALLHRRLGILTRGDLATAIERGDLEYGFRTVASDRAQPDAIACGWDIYCARQGAIGTMPVLKNLPDADVLAILRESQRRFLVLVKVQTADAIWARLLHAGDKLGAAFVGRDALTLLDAALLSSG